MLSEHTFPNIQKLGVFSLIAYSILCIIFTLYCILINPMYICAVKNTHQTNAYLPLHCTNKQIYL